MLGCVFAAGKPSHIREINKDDVVWIRVDSFIALCTNLISSCCQVSRKYHNCCQHRQSHAHKRYLHVSPRPYYVLICLQHRHKEWQQNFSKKIYKETIFRNLFRSAFAAYAYIIAPQSCLIKFSHLLLA